MTDPAATQDMPGATEDSRDETLERYRRALVQIADSESGVWGWIAHEALHPKTPTTGDAA